MNYRDIDIHATYRRYRMAVVSAMASVLVAAGAFVGLRLLPSVGSDDPIQISLSRANEVGPAPFVVLVRGPVPSIADDILIILLGDDPGKVVAGATPGLYGGTSSRPSCDRKDLAEALTDSQRAGTWTGVFGIDAEDLVDYLGGLTPVQLQVDVRVTDHRFVQGSVAARQAVLQAGSPVLIDANGVPRVRCLSGSPILGPVGGSQLEIVDVPWIDFDEERLVRIVPSAAQRSFSVVQASTGHLVDRPIGTDGAADTFLSDPTDGAGPGVVSAPSPVEDDEFAAPSVSTPVPVTPTPQAEEPEIPTPSAGGQIEPQTDSAAPPPQGPVAVPQVPSPPVTTDQNTAEGVPDGPEPATPEPPAPETPDPGDPETPDPDDPEPTVPDPAEPEPAEPTPDQVAVAVMPSVVGMSTGDAMAALQAAGFQTKVVQTTEGCNTVAVQSRPAGLEFDLGTRVTLYAIC
ncbi:MAG: hypothetical protein ACI8TP_001298 [Acidimicrobiales bacterium]|jgi:hypothetical protein